MADINVFELTNKELHKSEKPVAKMPKTAKKKSVKESFAKTRSAKRRRPFSIPANKLKLESLSHYLMEEEDGVESDVVADYTPNDDVVLVIDPEMDEVPDDLEQAEEQAEELIGDHVCKCSICGANYVTDAEITEDFEMEEETCPVCGEEGEQIVVGVITPTEELSDDDAEEIDDVDVEDEEGADEEEFSEEEFEDEDGTEEEFAEEEEDFGESVRRSRARTLRRKAESVRRPARRLAKRPARRTESTARRTKRVMPRKAYRPVTESKAVAFDEKTFNRMLTKFAKENYSNVKFVRISKGTVRGNRLTLEGTVTTTKGSKRAIKFISESFKQGKRMTLRFRESGPFTESVKSSAPTFIVDCFMRGSMIVPATLKYNFKAKENKNTYSVTGKVLSESVSAPKRTARPRRNRK